MPYYQDANLAMTVIVDDTLQERNNQCNWVLHATGFYMLQCASRKITLTEKEKDRIAIEIVGTVVSQFRFFKKYLLDPFELSYAKLPLTADIQTGYHCAPGNVAHFQTSTPPEIRLCSTNIVSDVRHEATHWFLWALNENFSIYKLINEGYASYFADGVCSIETKTYAYRIRNSLPKIADLLSSNQQEVSYYNHYILGSLLCATLHQHAKKEHFLTLLAAKQHPSNPKKFQQLYQTHFENFVRNLSHFCQLYPGGIFPRSKTTGTIASRMSRHAAQLTSTLSMDVDPSRNIKTLNSSNSNLSFTARLTTQGFVGIVNGSTYFFLEKIAEKLQKNYPRLDRSLYYLAQPILSSAIHSAQTLLVTDITSLTYLEMLENSAMSFSLNCVSGVAIQLLIQCISYGIGERTSNTLLKSIFFLHTMAMVIRSDNPAETIIEQLLSSAAAMLSYLLASLATRCSGSAENNLASIMPKHLQNIDSTKRFLVKTPNSTYFFKPKQILSPNNPNTYHTACLI